MRNFEKIFEEFIQKQFPVEDDDVKRVVIQDVPGFVQQILYEYFYAKEIIEIQILFTNVKGQGKENSLFISNLKDGILEKRNDYNIKRLVIISGIVLDRSSETAVTIVNELISEKWKWINASFGHYLLSSFFELASITGKDEQELIKKLLLTVGKKYDNGIERQWSIIVRLYLLANSPSFKTMDDLLSFTLGLPKVGLHKDISHSFAVLDQNINFKRVPISNTITSLIQKKGLIGFKEYVYKRIEEIGDSGGEFELLCTELSNQLNTPVDIDFLTGTYKTAFEQYFSSLTSETINTLDITTSPVFHYIPGLRSTEPLSWWSLLTSNFWYVVLEEGRSQNTAIEIKVLNREDKLSSASKSIILTSSLSKGLVVFEVVNFEIVKEALTMRIGKGAAQSIEENTFSFSDEKYIEKPLVFIFESANSKKNSIKVMPLDRFAGGIIPVVINAPLQNIIPVSKDGNWNANLELNTKGRNKILLLVGESCTLMENELVDEYDNKIPINLAAGYSIPGIIVYEATFWLEGEVSEITFSVKYKNPFGEEKTLFTHLMISQENQGEANSVFRRLVKTHVTRKMPSVEAGFNTKHFLDQFESWIIRNKTNSHKPVYISIDKVENENTHWIEVEQNGWHSLNEKLTAKQFIVNEYNLPRSLTEAREKILSFIKDASNGLIDYSSLLRNIDLTDYGVEFETLIVNYLTEYELALRNDSLCEVQWMDIHPLIFDKNIDDVIITSKHIIGLVVSPYHPLRLYWQLRAQQELKCALDGIKGNYKYNPAASSLDPSIVPDFVVLRLKSILGESAQARFISVTNDSDYWGILMMSESNPHLENSDNRLEGFWKKLGVRIEGLNQGLFPSQVERSLKDVSKLMVTHDKLKVTLQGTTKGYEEEGIFNWLKNVTNPSGEGDAKTYLQEYVWNDVRSRSLEIHDARPAEIQPDDYSLLEEYLQSNENVKWFNVTGKDKRKEITDLSIICNLGLDSISMAHSEEIGSPTIGPLLYKHRLIKVLESGNQVPLKEQRKTNCVAKQGCISDSVFLSAINILEGGDKEKTSSIAISPRIDLLAHALNSSHLSVVSSSLVSPTTFALLSQRDGQGELYLWDFDLPSFNSTSNTKNGYYLLAHPKLAKQASLIKNSFSKYLNLFHHFRNQDSTSKDLTCSTLLSEYISRGLPSLKKLVYGGNAFRGEIGNLIALRILQGSGNSGLIPIITDDNTLNLVIPIDPFQDIIEKMPREDDDNRSRPDLLIISYKRCSGFSVVKLIPLEVKFRKQKEAKWEDHIIQATNFSKFLNKIFTLSEDWVLWKTAFCSIVGRMVEYGLNLAASVNRKNNDFDKIYSLGFDLLSDVFNNLGRTRFEFDPVGRLIYINADENDSSNGSAISNVDHPECLLVNYFDAQEILFTSNGVQKFITSNPLGKKKAWNLQAECNENVLEKPGTISVELKDIDSPHESDFFNTDEPEVDGTTKGIDTNTATFNSEQYLKDYPLGLKFLVGKTDSRFGVNEYYFNPGSTDINQLNIGVIGDLGTGKTQLLKSLVYQMSKEPKENRGESPKFLILDTKRDYDGTGSALDKEFIKNINAEVVIPYKIKLNIFDIKGSTEINPAQSKAKFFIDLLSKIYGGIGPIQKDTLRDAIIQSFKNRGYVSAGQYQDFVSPTLVEIRDLYKSLIGSTDSALAIINGLVSEELFEENPAQTISFKEMFSNSCVIALGTIANSSDSLKLMMVIFLKLYQDYMLGIEKYPYIGENPSLRKIDSFIMIDEAKLIMDYNFQVLEDLLRKGREFGVGVILSTQYLSDFTGGKIDYKEPLSTWFIHKVPNISVKELKSIGITGATEELVRQIQTLQKHYCLYKTINVNGKIIRGTPLFEQLQL